MPLSDKIKTCQARVEATLDHWLPGQEEDPQVLHGAMRYSVLEGGKRVRPILVYAAGEAFGVPMADLDGPAAAVEMIHAYSLIHDDLPAMDNDDLRRGRPTCHKAYDEATAILAGDAIQALAFHILALDPGIKVNPEQRIKMISSLTRASGSRGMAGGQAIDLAAVGRKLTLEELENMHRHKTGALIRASVELGALSSPDCTARQLEQLSEYAGLIGLAFQVHDDILDVESDTETLGKPQGSDIERNKPTYPDLLGLDGAKAVARELIDRALRELDGFDGRADTLRDLANYIIERRN